MAQVDPECFLRASRLGRYTSHVATTFFRLYGVTVRTDFQAAKLFTIIL